MKQARWKALAFVLGILIGAIAIISIAVHLQYRSDHPEEYQNTNDTYYEGTTDDTYYDSGEAVG